MHRTYDQVDDSLCPNLLWIIKDFALPVKAMPLIFLPYYVKGDFELLDRVTVIRVGRVSVVIIVTFAFYRSLEVGFFTWTVIIMFYFTCLENFCLSFEQNGEHRECCREYMVVNPVFAHMCWIICLFVCLLFRLLCLRFSRFTVHLIIRFDLLHLIIHQFL